MERVGRQKKQTMEKRDWIILIKGKYVRCIDSDLKAQVRSFEQNCTYH